MEALEAVFKELYTSFLLRDFAGKIVPGCFILASYMTLFEAPREILRVMAGRISLVMIFLVAGFSWTMVLGLQSLAEWAGLWSYYPVNGISEMTTQLRVVIKEATGNLFVAGLLSIPAWALWTFSIVSQPTTRQEIFGSWFTKLRALVVLLMVSLVMVGLCVMNHQHSREQYELAIGTLEKIDSGKPHECAPKPQPSPVKSQSE
jgi:hypothetical protein